MGVHSIRECHRLGMLCIPIFIRGQIKVKGQSFEVNSQATISLEVLGEGQNKILAKMSAIVGSMQCSNEKFMSRF